MGAAPSKKPIEPEGLAVPPTPRKPGIRTTGLLLRVGTKMVEAALEPDCIAKEMRRTPEQIDAIVHRLASTEPSTAADAVLKAMDTEELRALLTEVSDKPRVLHLDPMTVLLFKNFEGLSQACAAEVVLPFDLSLIHI